MAEQFIIRIQPDTPSSTTARGSDNWQTQAVGAGLLLGGGLSERKQFDQMQKLTTKLQNKFGRSDDTAFIAKHDPDSLETKGKIIQKISSTFQFEATGPGPDGTPKARLGTEQVTVSQLNPAIIENRAKITATGTALGLKIASSYVSYKQHRSGNTYYNNQLRNRMRISQYGLALGYGAAKGGPAGLALVAAGIAVNEGINAFTEASNFKYDRMMDTLYVHNIKQVAGDISYGRRRRGDR